jgi:long-chain fatty acid transport protein
MKRIALLLTLVLAAPAAFGAGFQLSAQGSRAMGMGLAYTAVAEDGTAIFYNPAGLATMKGNGELVFGAMWATKTDFSFTPTGGTEQEGRKGDDFVPQVYVSQRFGHIVAGVGVYTPFGLPVKWEQDFSGRSIAYTSLLKTLNVNPTIAGNIGNFSWGVGGDYMYSKIQLQRSLYFGIAEVPAKFKGELFDNSGWGWNAGVLYRLGAWRLGGAYRSAIDIDHDVTLTAFPSGNAAVDAGVAALIGPATVDIEYPSSLNLGIAYQMGNTIISADFDRTDWSSFDTLRAVRGTTVLLARNTNWDDSSAYRLGVQHQTGPVFWRAGVYRDRTPQPGADVGPILPDADRTGYTLGVGFGAPGGWVPSIDISDVYVRFQDRSAAAVATNLATRTLGMPAGTYSTTGNELALNAHWKW